MTVTLRLTVMMAETSRTSRVGAPGEDIHRSDPHWPGSATFSQPRVPRTTTLPFHLVPTLGALSPKFYSQLCLTGRPWEGSSPLCAAVSSPVKWEN